MTKQLDKFKSLLDKSKSVLVLQPEKPDSDSLASSLILEHFIGGMGKQVVMYCQDPIPDYIRCQDGWDRVTDVFPPQFDLTVLVDAGGPQMLARTLEKYQAKLSKKPFVILDHHIQREPMPFETIEIIDDSPANTEFLVKVAKHFGWKFSQETADLVMHGILADTRSMTTPHTTVNTLETMAEMMRRGGNINRVHVRFQETQAPDRDIIHFKGKLLSSVEYINDGSIALVVVEPGDLKKYGDRHDPVALVGPELQYTRGVDIAAIIRNYKSQEHGRKIKISFRSRHQIAAAAAKHFGGGGHLQAAGCTVLGREVDDVKKELIEVLTNLVRDAEAAQHSSA